MDELLNAVRRLKEDEGFYKYIVAEGYEAVKDHTIDKTTERWINMLEQQAVPLFYEWGKKYSYERVRSCYMTLLFEFDIIARKIAQMIKKCVRK